jgi:ABC-type multidrug transport system fused ATPase/permease subunit
LISYIAAVYQPLESISLTIGHLHQHFVFLNAALSLLDTEPEVKEDPDAIDIGRSRGTIEFDNVSFAYKGRVDTLKEISFKVEEGQRVALVGPTGAGKTTLASLLIRYYDPADGAIKIDGVDMKMLTLMCLRNQISVVLQEPLLFSGSIADNIRYGRLDASMDDIIEAARAANAHDFIEGLPQGYDTELGEGGNQLSGGERQRICVARAFIRNAPILILDEPTSSIDSRTELVILDALDRLMVGRTSFMIAHRLSTIRKADLIIVVNHGRAVEQGTHEELLIKGGLYYQLYSAQNGDVAEIEADHLRARLEAGLPLKLKAVNGNASQEGVEQQVIESLAQAVRLRVRGALANGGNGGNGVTVENGQGQAPPPNGGTHATPASGDGHTEPAGNADGTEPPAPSDPAEREPGS